MNTVVQNYPRQHHISLPHNTPHIPHNATNNVPNNTTKCMQVVGIPSVHIANNRLVVGSSSSSSTRSYTPLKVLGDGSFGTVWLCDWHGTLPPNTPLSPMQCGAGARPEWAGKRLVAVKRMKRRWDGGWDECQQLKELESLRAIPFHPNIIPLYDFFLLPATKELYFVFESMEGNLYHLIKARKGRPLAGGLVASIFFQIVSGLAHIHANGYFHRDMKPENVLVTTTGLFDYTPLSPPHTPPEKDVVAIIKLADFGLARETKSVPPYTEYVSTRWYRAPEVLLSSRDYSNPVDMWALGTIMAELVNLRPMFPGSDQVDQISRICQVLGNPDDYGEDSSGGPLGGGPWPKGLQMAEQVGFEFRKMPPQDIHSLFDPSVPLTLIHCIRDLLKFDPDARLTSHQCLHHPYLVETLPRNNIPLPPGVRLASQPRTSPPSHPLHIPNAATSHRSSFFPSSSPGPSHANGDPMDISPQTEVPPYPIPVPNASTPSKPLGKLSGLGKKFGLGRFGSDKHSNANPQQDLPAVQENIGPVASSSTGSLRLKRTQSTGSDRPFSSSPTREQSGSNDPKLVTKLNKKEAERLHREAEKQRRELALKTQREQARAVMQKRNMIIQNSKSAKEIEWTNTTGTEQPTVPPSVSGPAMSTMSAVAKGKQPAASLGPIRTSREHSHGHHIHTNGANVSPRFGHPPAAGSSMHHDMMDWRDGERSSKLRRMDFDDDSSAISSSDVHSTGRSMSRMSQISTVSQLSQISFATVASVDTVGSDPGPSRTMIRNRPSLLGLNRMSTASSLRTSFDFASSSNLSVPSAIPPVPPLPQMRLLTPSQSYPRSTRTPHTPHTPHTARSSNSFSLDGQLAHDFRTQASMETNSPHMNGMNGSVSPPPINLNILSLSASPSLSPRPSLDPLPISSPSPSQSQWTLQPHQRAETLSSRRGQASPGQIHVKTKRRSMSHSPSPYESKESRGYDYRERERSQESGERGKGSLFHAQHRCDAQGVGGYYHANNHPPQGADVGTNPGLKHSRSESDDINPIFKVVSFSYGSDSRGLDLALADKAKDKDKYDASVFNANLNPSSPSTSSYASSSYASSISYSHSHSLSLSSYSQPPLPTPSTSSESEEYYNDNDSESEAMDTYPGDYTYSPMDDRMESPDPQDYSSDDYHSSGMMYGDQHPYQRNPNLAVYPYPSPDPNATHLNGLPNGLHRHHQRHPPSLPPFAALDAVAGGGYDHPSLSPMSFTTPLESDASSS